METDPVFKTSCFYSQKHQTMEKVQKTSNSETRFTPTVICDMFPMYDMQLHPSQAVGEKDNTAADK
jgi:hypothetical protein